MYVCTTNLDDYKREEWPTGFVTCPRIGDRVESKSGKILSVVGITHRFPQYSNSLPTIQIELHFPPNSWALRELLKNDPSR